MYAPIRRWRAVVVGLVFGLACSHAAQLSAGVVAPPASDASPTTEVATDSERVAEVTPALPLLGASDAQPFWFPGADGGGSGSADAFSISTSPVQPNDIGPGLHGLQQHPLIPLPGAAWTGMAGLLGLGTVKLLRNARRLLA